jgi:hypothetical protein
MLFESAFSLKGLFFPGILILPPSLPPSLQEITKGNPRLQIPYKKTSEPNQGL